MTSEMVDPEQGWRPTDAAEDELAIGAVSRALGVSPSTIRLWEWRHQLPTGRTGQGSERRYTRADISTLARMRDETAAGRGVAAAVALVAAATSAQPPQIVDRLVAATHRLHIESISEALQQARRNHGLTVTLEQVVLPALQEIGRQWAEGRADPAHEHLLAGAVQAWLADQQRQTGPPRHPGAVVLACGPDDQHTLALEAFALLLADRGFDCRYLGAKTPVSSLVLAAKQPPARAVVVVSHLDQNRASAVAALQALAALPVPAFYAGAAFSLLEQRHDLPGTHLGETLSGAAQHIAATLAPH